MSDGSISINKYVSSTGLCSRREADRWIEEGRVQINGKNAKKGNRVLPDDQVIVDGQIISKKPKLVYLAFHKPTGVTCTTDKNDPSNIIDFMNYPKRIFPVGRLDKDSTGLILMTNDGNIVNDILRAENENEKEYLVRVHKAIDGDFIQKMSNGIFILGKRTKKCKVERISKHDFKITLTQGLNRQIRRMCNALDYKVTWLTRVRIMNIKIDNLAPGKWRHLSKTEIRELEQKIIAR